MPIAKKCIFVTSVGRTGTRFIGKTFGDIVPNSISFHEPDLLTPRHLREWTWKLKAFGPVNMTFGKVFGNFGMRQLSHKRMAGNLTDDQAIRSIIEQRGNFIASLPYSVYIESNCTFYGIFDLLPKSLPITNSVFIVRDPRTWVRSRMDWGDWYGKWDYNSLLQLERLNPMMFAEEDESKALWGLYKPFQKLCWAWNKITTFAISRAGHDDRLKIFKYEDLFLSSNRYEHMRELLESVTVFPDGSRCNYNLPEGILNKVIHASKKKFAAWPEWPPELARQLDMICGTIMKEFDYGVETEWKGKLSS